MQNHDKTEPKSTKHIVQEIVRLWGAVSHQIDISNSEGVITELATRFGEVILSYRGKVTDTNVLNGELKEETVRVEFEKNGEKTSRLFPKKRLAAIKAAFEGAEIEFTLHNLGSTGVSTLRYVGPPAEELTERQPLQLSREALEKMKKY